MKAFFPCTACCPLVCMLPMHGPNGRRPFQACLVCIEASHHLHFCSLSRQPIPRPLSSCFFFLPGEPIITNRLATAPVPSPSTSSSCMVFSFSHESTAAPVRTLTCTSRRPSSLPWTCPAHSYFPAQRHYCIRTPASCNQRTHPFHQLCSMPTCTLAIAS